MTDKPKVVTFKKPQDDGVDAIISDFLTNLNEFETEMNQRFHHIVLAASTDEGVTMTRYYGSTPHCAFLAMALQHHLMDAREDLE